ncbi:hypothetical protein Ahy_A04g017150 isoform A [Arachis hypogaea]|uniref:Uncharacterized protein n=1 Tax=Arachis hypogaea TaxID=3818 RepID=A0A445DA71_ARAHY|nr:hypothetical protein Ahy_A04g017150 isoform A [Arachis hypogaea]
MRKKMSSSVIHYLSISSSMAVSLFSQLHLHPLLHGNNKISLSLQSQQRFHSPSKAISIIQCCSSSSNHSIKLRTCKNCKSQFDPSLNHPLACRFHTAHFGGETKRNIGIAADPKIPSILAALLHLTPPMMTDKRVDLEIPTRLLINGGSQAFMESDLLQEPNTLAVHATTQGCWDELLWWRLSGLLSREFDTLETKVYVLVILQIFHDN